MSSCDDSGNYWYWIVIIAIFIILLVIIVMLATSGSSNTPAPVPTVCKSAEYPTIAENMSCEPNIVEVSLTASDNEVQILNGDATKLYNYNKSFPGPLIEAKKGDTLIVHFFNDISEPSTITWHGLLTPANMDGSQISSDPVLPGDSFNYKFELTQAGLYWYHSDINSREQVSMGLFGVILVKDYDEDNCYSLPKNEKVLAFSDLKLNSANQVDIEFSSIPCERLSQQVNGILGNVLLTNGVYEGCISLVKNEPTRLRMVNCATDRFMKIVLEGHDMLRIGGDQGLLEKPILIKEENGLMLTTGERADIVFVPRHDKIRLYTVANPRGTQKVIPDECGNCELTDEVVKSDEKLLLVTFEAHEEKQECDKLEVPLELKRIKKIKVDNCTPVIPVNYGNLEPDCEGNVEFYAFKSCGKGIPFPSLSRKEAPIVFEDGTYIIEVTNTSPLANNFYLHGFTFQHIDTLFIRGRDIEKVPNCVLENKDTIYIPAKPCAGRGKTVVRLAVTFSSKNREIIAYGKEPTKCRSGGWIFSSHILTHADLGQEGFIQIVAECDRRTYSSSCINSYSKYSSEDHSRCLTKSSKGLSSSGNCSRKGSNSSRETKGYSNDGFSRDSFLKGNDLTSMDDITTSLEEITKSLVTCKCGSGMNSSLCNCEKSDFSRWDSHEKGGKKGNNKGKGKGKEERDDERDDEREDSIEYKDSSYASYL